MYSYVSWCIFMFLHLCLFFFMYLWLTDSRQKKADATSDQLYKYQAWLNYLSILGIDSLSSVPNWKQPHLLWVRNNEQKTTCHFSTLSVCFAHQFGLVSVVLISGFPKERELIILRFLRFPSVLWQWWWCFRCKFRRSSHSWWTSLLWYLMIFIRKNSTNMLKI